MEMYFAYGSNLDLEQVKRRCRNHGVVKVSIGYLPDHRLAFTQFYEPWGGGVADVVKGSNSRVWGVLYELSMNALKLLDEHEGYSKEDYSSSDYVRTQHSILTPEGHQYLAWVYSVLKKDGDFIPPSKKYMDVIIRTARESGFPQDYLSYLNSIKTADVY